VSSIAAFRAPHRFLLCSLAIAGALIVATAAPAQQRQPPEVDVSVAAPAFARDEGPTVAIDAAHQNVHTVEQTYAPFANLLRNDGFKVAGSTWKFSADALKGTQILVISNPMSERNPPPFDAPIHSAFTADEVTAVRAWVEAGGSLLLIVDHYPVPGVAANLGAAFGFTLHNAYAGRDDRFGPDVFSVDEGSLKDDPVLRGRESSEAVRQISTFGGSAFDIPASARPIIVLPAGFELFFTTRINEFKPDTPRRNAAGLSQGAVMEVGKGRVAIFGEAAMFTYQGLAKNTESPNKQFILNLLRWLSHAQR